MLKRDNLKRILDDLAATDEGDIPLGRDVARRETIVQHAIEAADALICEFCEGEEMNMVTAQVAIGMMEKVLRPLVSGVLRLDIERAVARKEHRG